MYAITSVAVLTRLTNPYVVNFGFIVSGFYLLVVLAKCLEFWIVKALSDEVGDWNVVKRVQISIAVVSTEIFKKEFFGVEVESSLDMVHHLFFCWVVNN